MLTSRTTVNVPCISALPKKTTSYCRTVRCQSQQAGASTQSKQDALRELSSFKSGLSAQLQAAEHQLKASAAAVQVEAPTVTEFESVGAPDNDLHELHPTHFDDLITSAGASLVLIKFTSSKCGPCKLMMPKLVAMRDEFAANNAKFVKIMMTSAAKELGSKLGIKVAPSFLLYKDGKQVGFITGTKEKELREAIQAHL